VEVHPSLSGYLVMVAERPPPDRLGAAGFMVGQMSLNMPS
jgi:hypothetical protein